MTVPSERITDINDAPIHGDAKYVLYWMIAFRRRRHNHALEHAAAKAVELGLPLVVLEPLRNGYRWASDRLHAFVVDGMRDNAAAFAGAPVTYVPYVERNAREGKGLLEAMAEDAALVVTDDYPCFFLPRMVRAAAARLPVRAVMVDSNGLLPVRRSDKVWARAHDFRRFMHRELRSALEGAPSEDPLAKLDLPRLGEAPFASLRDRWPLGDLESVDLASLPIDHTVAVAPHRGGSQEAEGRMRAFLNNRLAAYADGRNHPDDDTASGLSPWLHFGHLSSWEVLDAIAAEEGWSPDQLPEKATGKREGWWKLSAGAEAFLDELVTWRELGFSTSALDPHYDEYESLPEWAQTTLAEHQDDARTIYDPADLEAAKSEDDIWNAAQRQLLGEGKMHNYLRMLWGKRILEWTPTPQKALELMEELNNKYALDGRDPNSYSGIFWVLGRYDRPWGPERPIFGKVRYMTSDSTRKKLHLKEYLKQWGPDGGDDQPKQLRLMG